MTRHIRATKKGISPVIATVILVAVAITVSVSVAYWMGGISSLYTTLEKIEVSSAIVAKNGNNYTITMAFRNTGSKDATIDAVFLNQQPSTAYAGRVSVATLPTSVVAGGSGSLVVSITNSTAPPFTPGTTIEVKLHTAAGKEYPQMLTLT